MVDLTVKRLIQLIRNLFQRTETSKCIPVSDYISVKYWYAEHSDKRVVMIIFFICWHGLPCGTVEITLESVENDWVIVKNLTV